MTAPTPHPDPSVPVPLDTIAARPERPATLAPTPDAPTPPTPPPAAEAAATPVAADATAPARPPPPNAVIPPAPIPAAVSPSPARRNEPVDPHGTAPADTARTTVATAPPPTGPVPPATTSTDAAGGGIPADASPTTPAAQVAHVLIGLPIAGSHRVTVQLSPAELGRVQISIERSADGTATINVTAERPETLALVQGDTAQLHAALDRAGVGGHGRTLHFALAAAGTIETARAGEPIRTAADTPASTLADAGRTDPAGQPMADPLSRSADAPASGHAPDGPATSSAGAQGGTEHSGEGRRNADPGTNGQNANAHTPRHTPAGVADAGPFIAPDTPGVRRLAARGIDITA